MASLDDIRRALAANLRLVLPEDEGHVGAYYQGSTKVPALHVMGVTGLEIADVGGGLRYEFGIEGALGRIVDKASWRRLDGWIEGGGVMYALDSDVNPLTSRLLDDGTLAEEEEDAGTCAFLRMGVPTSLTRGGAEVLVQSWFCEVYPPAEIFT